MYIVARSEGCAYNVRRPWPLQRPMYDEEATMPVRPSVAARAVPIIGRDSAVAMSGSLFLMSR